MLWPFSWSIIWEGYLAKAYVTAPTEEWSSCFDGGTPACTFEGIQLGIESAFDFMCNWFSLNLLLNYQV